MPPPQAIARDIMYTAVQNKTCQWQHAQLSSVHPSGSAGEQQLSRLLADSTSFHRILKHSAKLLIHRKQCNICAPSQSVWHDWANTGIARPQTAPTRAAGQARHGICIQGRCGITVRQPLQNLLSAAAPPSPYGGSPVYSMVQPALSPLHLHAGPRRQPKLRLDVVHTHVWKQRQQQQHATTHLHLTALTNTNKRSNSMWRVISVTFFCIWPISRLLQIHDSSRWRWQSVHYRVLPSRCLQSDGAALHFHAAASGITRSGTPRGRGPRKHCQ